MSVFGIRFVLHVLGVDVCLSVADDRIHSENEWHYRNVIASRLKQYTSHMTM